MDDFAAEVDRQRERNTEKAAREAREGPVRETPDATPIGEAIEDFHRRGDVVFGIPAHRSGTGQTEPIAARWLGGAAFRADLGMDKGVDTRHQSWQVESTAMRLFARAVGADQTMFSTNGSTENVHVAMMAAVRPGEKLVMARNGHKSAFSGLVLSGAMPVYVEPAYDPRWQIAHSVSPDSVDEALRKHPDAVAAMVFTPTYYGISPDVRGLADAAHTRDVPLLTDDAWGLDYSFCSRLPPSALQSGADLCIGSAHKSLNALAQTSVLSVQGDRIDSSRLSLMYDLTQSTSASSLLLSSIDAARQQFQQHGEEMLGHAIDVANAVRAAIGAMPGLDLMGEEVLGSPAAVAMDPTHVTFDVIGLGITGFQAADWLRQHHGIHMELADHRRLMALISFADTDATARRLIDALSMMVEEHANATPLTISGLADLPGLLTETVMLPRDAMLGATDMVPWRKAAGRICAELICPYPPGIAVAAPGEVLTHGIVDYLQMLAAEGIMVEGAADQSLAEFRVVSP